MMLEAMIDYALGGVLVVVVCSAAESFDGTSFTKGI